MPVWPVISQGSVFSHSCSAELKNLQSLWHALASHSAHDHKYAPILKLLISCKFMFKNVWNCQVVVHTFNFITQESEAGGSL